MDDNKKLDETKKPDEGEKKPDEQDTEDETKPEDKPEGEPKDKPKDEPEDKGEPEEKPEDKAKDEDGDEKAAPEPPALTREQELEAENFRLKTQLEAMKIGFSPDCLEDAVVLAENISKRDKSDITTALQAVAKKYPDWKADESGKQKGGFKIGADSSKQKPTSDEKLNKAFGINKKKN